MGLTGGCYWHSFYLSILNNLHRDGFLDKLSFSKPKAFVFKYTDDDIALNPALMPAVIELPNSYKIKYDGSC
jgi:hypothetical protein